MKKRNLGTALKPFTVFFLTPFLANPGFSAEQKLTSSLLNMGFSDLMNLEVLSVSKKEDKLSETAAAVYVLTGEEIRRSGARNIPDALRLVPGLQVAQVGAGGWAITSRGFNGTVANKLQVLIDGRSVYSPLFSGVFWDAQHVLMENIDRIEIIRGPGAVVWGANAVNGVINIIRKPAAETQGDRLSAGGGTEQRAFGQFIHGDRMGARGHYRTHVQYFDSDGTESPTGADARDNWHMTQAGFRADFNASSPNSYLISVDAYNGQKGENSPVNTLTPPFRIVHRDQTDIAGGNVMGRWMRELSARSKLQLQFYYDRTRRHIPLVFEETRDTYDVEFQHQFPWGARQNFNWGIGSRFSDDRVHDSFGIDFDPDRYGFELYNAFLQDEIRLHKKFIFTIGSKVEQNDYTGIEIQPNVRAAWMINSKNTVWSSVSRAVRMPTRFDRDIRVQAVTGLAPLTAVSFRGDDRFESEELVAYELGYRVEPSAKTFFDVATFYNDYDNLRSVEPGPSFTEDQPTPSHLVNPFFLLNKARAESYGIELAPQTQITDNWLIQGQYTYLHLRIHLDEDSRDVITAPSERNDPRHQFSLRSSLDLPKGFELDGVLRHVDNLPNLNVGSYTVADVRIGYAGIRNLDLELVGQNLLDRVHQEFSPGNRIQRGAYAKATLHF